MENVRTDRLGLSIVQTMVKDKLRGNLSVESGPGGTHVTFDFKNQIDPLILQRQYEASYL